MADYTDIGKLRELLLEIANQPSVGDSDSICREAGWRDRARVFLADFDALTATERGYRFMKGLHEAEQQRADAADAELVGLRTEVDQLRGEVKQIEWAESLIPSEPCERKGADGEPLHAPTFCLCEYSHRCIWCMYDDATRKAEDFEGRYETSHATRMHAEEVIRSVGADRDRLAAERVTLNELRHADAAALADALAQVDQLRGENAELRENVVHMESERTGKCLACGKDWTCRGYYADIAHEARVENLITAERDALQARIDALERSAFESAGFTRGTERAAIVQLIHDGQAVYIHDPHNRQLQHEPTHERVVWRGPWEPEPRCPGCRQRLRDLRAANDNHTDCSDADAKEPKDA